MSGAPCFSPQITDTHTHSSPAQLTPLTGLLTVKPPFLSHRYTQQHDAHRSNPNPGSEEASPTTNGLLLLLKLGEKAVLHTNGFLFTDCQMLLALFSDLTDLVSRVPPCFWDRRSQPKWYYLWSGDCAETNVHPDRNETGNPETQNILLKQFNKKIVKFLENLEKPKACCVCHLS